MTNIKLASRTNKHKNLETQDDQMIQPIRVTVFQFLISIFYPLQLKAAMCFA